MSGACVKLGEIRTITGCCTGYKGFVSVDSLISRLAPIRLFAMDVDGVLTNGDIIYPATGDEIKVFNVKDGHGLSLLSHHGMTLAFITGRNSPVTQRRADELGVQYVYQGIKAKRPVLETLMMDLKLKPEQVCYMGDDTPDLPLLKWVGLSACPTDALDVVKDVCFWESRYHGGRGAVRELCDLMLEHAEILSTNRFKL